MLQEAFGSCDPASDLGKDILKSIQSLSKSAPPTKAAPGVGMEALRGLLSGGKQNAMLEAVQRLTQQGGGAAGGPPGQPAGGAAPAA